MNVVLIDYSLCSSVSYVTVNVSTLKTYFQCNGYKGYHMVYNPQRGLTCVSPCREGYCEHGGQCQHLPNGPCCR